MHTTEPITPTASGPRTLGDAAVEIGPLVTGVFVAGPPVVVAWAGTVVFALLLAGPVVLFATVVVALAAVAAVVTLAGAILAMPYLLVRHLAPRLAKLRHVSEGRARVAVNTPATERPR
jgi:hypothetical protein